MEQQPLSLCHQQAVCQRTVHLQVHLECHSEAAYWVPVPAVMSPTPCNSSPAGTVQCRAPALTPRAAYGKAIRASVPLKRGTERNTTALNTMPRLPFQPALFFSSSKNSCKTPYYSLLFQFISPLACCLISQTHSFHLTLNSLLILPSLSPFFLHSHWNWKYPNSDFFPHNGQRLSVFWTANPYKESHFFTSHLGHKDICYKITQHHCGTVYIWTVSLVFF